MISKSIRRLEVISRQFSMAPISQQHYDYLVIGGGSGGVASARRAASYGKKVLLIEAQYKKLGGTCVNVGCVPKKVMWYTADLAHKVAQLKSYGLLKDDGHIKYGDFDWKTLKTKRDAYITRLNGIYENNLNKEKVDYVYGFASFNSEQNVDVKLSNDQDAGKKGETLTFTADKVLVATGGTPIFPEVPGAELGISSDGFFELDYQPKSVLIVGAGYIAVELAGVFNALGTKTHLAIRGDQVLRKFDNIVRDNITDHYINKLGINIIKQSGSIKSIEKGDGNIKKVTLGNGETYEVDEVLFTVGRKSLLGINLDAVNVKVNDKNQVIADEYQVTSNSKIFSLGDVVGKVELTPVAIAAGRKLSNRLFSGKAEFEDDKLDYTNIPSVVFSHPESGSIGLTTDEAIEEYGKDNIKTYNAKFNAMYYAMMDSDDLKSPTVYKIIVEGPNEKVVGLHLVGDSSAEILQGFGVAIKMGATKKDFDNCVAIHPTSAEELVTMR